MANDVRKNLIEKYKENGTFASMEAAGEMGDMGVLFDKLIYTYKVKTGMIPAEGADVYAGIPEGFNWEEFAEDYETLG